MLSESWSKYLKSLEKLILPMNFWEADGVVVLGRPFDVDVFSFLGGLRRENCWAQFESSEMPLDTIRHIKMAISLAMGICELSRI